MGRIQVNDLGKAYRQYPKSWSRLAEWLDPRSRSYHVSHWVVRNVSFTLEPGEVVGIVGINGAGKSTLLKMIAGILTPTAGSVKVEGRLAALLELGMGFDPNFTGRQNVMMAGQLLGLSEREVTQLMPSIAAFAEIGDYLDQAVRTYSSGMQVRLAFSVATAKRPDILIVDEALSVGDAYFQHKSFDRIRAFRAAGTTMLLVSHAASVIQSICDRVVLLNHGEVAMVGEPEVVMDYYNALLASHQEQELKQVALDNGKMQTISGTGDVTSELIQLLDAHGNPVELIEVGTPLTLRVIAKTHTVIDQLVFGYSIKDRLGQVVFGTNTFHTGQVQHGIASDTQITFEISFDANLGPGTYSIQTALVSSETHLVNNYEWRDLAQLFTVVNTHQPVFAGVAWIAPHIKIKTS